MMLDVFKGDAFSFTELVKAINLIHQKMGEMLAQFDQAPAP